MNTATRPICSTPSIASEALVTGCDDDGALSLRCVASGVERRARVAMPGYAPTPGDRVLVVPTGGGALFVVGAVRMSAAPTIRAGDVTASADGMELVVRNADGATILRYDAGHRTLSFEAPGDLELAAPAGTVRIRGRRVEVDAVDLAHRAERVTTEASRIASSADRVEVWANRIEQRAKEAWIEVEERLTTRAGRVRTVVRHTLQILAERTSLRSRQDTAIDGKRVLLG